jgi:CHASE2 domain-containing sensor protein
VIPYQDLVDPRSPALRQMFGKIVVVGENTSSEKIDVVETPVGKMKGFEVHAQILNTLLDGFFPQFSQPGTRFYLADCCFILWLCNLLAFNMVRAPTPARMCTPRWPVPATFLI